MKLPLIIDFDGTLFNTLPVYYKFKKERLYQDEDKIRYHHEFIIKNKSQLDEYSKEWRQFLLKAQEAFRVFLISESPYEEMILYLKAFQMEHYFLEIFGKRLAKDGTRESKIKELIFLYNQAYLISDNPSDLGLRIDYLKVYSSQYFYLDGFNTFCQRLNEIYLNLEKSTSAL